MTLELRFITECGVPHGAILGSLFFALMVNNNFYILAHSIVNRSDLIQHIAFCMPSKIKKKLSLLLKLQVNFSDHLCTLPNALFQANNNRQNHTKFPNNCRRSLVLLLYCPSSLLSIHMFPFVLSFYLK